MAANETKRIDVPAALHAKIVEYQETYGRRTVVDALDEMVTVVMAYTAEDRAKVRKEQQTRMERFGIKPPTAKANQTPEPAGANGHP